MSTGSPTPSSTSWWSHPSGNVDAGLRRARAMESMPLTAAAARFGVLSTDQVDLLASVNAPKRRDLFLEHEATLVGKLRELRYLPSCRAVRYWRHRADAMLGLDDTRADEHAAAAHLHASTTIDGMVAIDGILDPVGGPIVTAQLDRLIAELREGDREQGVDRGRCGGRSRPAIGTAGIRPAVTSQRFGATSLRAQIRWRLQREHPDEILPEAEWPASLRRAG